MSKKEKRKCQFIRSMHSSSGKRQFQQDIGYRGERASKPLKTPKNKKNKNTPDCALKPKPTIVSTLHMLSTNPEAAATCFI